MYLKTKCLLNLCLLMFFPNPSTFIFKSLKTTIRFYTKCNLSSFLSLFILHLSFYSKPFTIFLPKHVSPFKLGINLFFFIIKLKSFLIRRNIIIIDLLWITIYLFITTLIMDTTSASITLYGSFTS